MDPELVEKAKEVIANGCVCDRGCEEFSDRSDVFCGCRTDAETVIKMVMERYAIPEGGVQAG